jgi:hypothetical protein
MVKALLATEVINVAITKVIIEMKIFRKKNPHQEKFHALRQSTVMGKFSYLRCPTNTLRILSPRLLHIRKIHKTKKIKISQPFLNYL